MSSKISFSIRKGRPEDVPSIGKIFDAAFQNDIHTLVKWAAGDTPDEPMTMGPPDHWYQYLESTEKATVVVAVDDETGKVLGFAGYGLWNYDGTKPVVSSSIS